jgi:hypothetical protein
MSDLVAQRVIQDIGQIAERKSLQRQRYQNPPTRMRWQGYDRCGVVT